MKNFLSAFAVLFLLVLIAGCASNPYAKTNRWHKKQTKTLTKRLKNFPPEKRPHDDILNYGENWVGTVNFNLRKPNYVIIHHTAQDSLEQTLKTFTLPRTQVSAHYVISEDGEIYHMLSDYFRAWHGGVGKWGHNTDLNSSSIGIELDNNGHEPFPPAQINSLIKLLGVLKEKYNIPTANFIGHADIAPTRKNDP
ncbi:MAG TPA: N-acetylmuramoyl-L-alanine amidase, partial [Salinimicrobium sp.]|nr:N-acetylmuramoyl-L-alanine amidase [Salinimicrobium sp.]